jgi:acetyl-CoA carboxylase biotin carboxyl carrier protein
MDLTYKDVQSILKIIDAAEHLNEIELVLGGFRLHVIRNGGGEVKGSGPARVAAVSAPQAVQDSKPPASSRPIPIADTPVPEGAIAIRAPMLGIFYRARAPGEKPFVEVGQKVRADDTVCLIEVMKLFNSIRAGVDGEVVQILAENGGLVEFNQPLIFVAPAKKS